MRMTRVDGAELTRTALAQVNAAQKATLEICLKNGWSVMQLIYNFENVAVNVAVKGLSCWITPDGKLHRPVKGKKSVSINTRTLERVW